MSNKLYPTYLPELTFHVFKINEDWAEEISKITPFDYSIVRWHLDAFGNELSCRELLQSLI